MFGVSFFPTDAVSTVTSGVTGFLSDNLLVILGVLAFTVGIKLVLNWLRFAGMVDSYEKKWKKAGYL